MLHLFVIGKTQPVEASGGCFLFLDMLVFSLSSSFHFEFLSVTVRHKKDQIHALPPPTPVLLPRYVSEIDFKKSETMKTENTGTISLLFLSF